MGSFSISSKRNWDIPNARNAYDMATCALDTVNKLKDKPVKIFSDTWESYQIVLGRKNQGGHISFNGGTSGTNVLSIGTTNATSDNVKITSINTLTVNTGVTIFSNGRMFLGSSPIDSGIYQLEVNGTTKLNDTIYTRHIYPDNEGSRNIGDSSAVYNGIHVSNIRSPLYSLSVRSNLHVLFGPLTGGLWFGGFFQTGGMFIQAPGIIASNAGYMLDVHGTTRISGRVTLANDTKYDSNSAAIAGGLSTGMIYTTSTGELRKVI